MSGKVNQVYLIIKSGDIKGMDQSIRLLPTVHCSGE
jgi:hypothetical protein